jgi:hypothetical protein
VDKYRLRIRMGQAEFEAEGPRPQVHEDYERFLSRLGREGTAPSPLPTDAPMGGPAPQNRVDLLYQVDKNRGVLSLRILPSIGSGVIRHVANAILIILYGFKEYLGADSVPVLALANALRQSGHTGVKRLSTSCNYLLKNGLLIKQGTGKGSLYKASNLGLQTARSIIHATLERANLTS